MRNFTLKSSFTTIRSVRYAFVFLLLISSTTVLAQQFHSTSPYMQSSELQTEQYQGPEVGYHSTIYTPFSNETPSNNNAPAGITGRKNTVINPGNGDDWGSNSDGGDQENSSPIGEPWIMLAFAVIAAVVITLRKKQTA
jgi:hypothetical protein